MSWTRVGGNRWVSNASMFPTAANVGNTFTLGNNVLRLEDYTDARGVYPLGEVEILHINGEFKMYSINTDSQGPTGSKFIRTVAPM